MKLANGKERVIWRIDKRDERGSTIDVHALRTTFGKLLSKGGVPLRTAQAAMRHSTPVLTALDATDQNISAKTLQTNPDYPIPSRDDKTPLELFIAGVQGWEVGLRRDFENSKSKHA